MDLKKQARKLKENMPVVFLVLRDSRTPMLAKLVAGLTVTYALSPIDLIPDFIPVLGYLDDVILLPLLIALTIKLIPKDVWADNKRKAAGMDRRKKRWYYGIPVVMIWLIILWAVLTKCFFK